MLQLQYQGMSSTQVCTTTLAQVKGGETFTKMGTEETFLEIFKWVARVYQWPYESVVC